MRSPKSDVELAPFMNTKLALSLQVVWKEMEHKDTMIELIIDNITINGVLNRKISKYRSKGIWYIIY